MNLLNHQNLSLCEKCPYSELFWSTFSRIGTECEEILRISPYSVRMGENEDQNNSEHEHFYAVIILCGLSFMGFLRF